MFGRRLINTKQGGGCTTDTLQILGDTSCVATYRLNGDATDLSGNYNGTATSVTYVTGKFGDAADFSVSNSYIDIPSNVSPSVDVESFNYSFWISIAAAFTGAQTIVGETTDTGPVRIIVRNVSGNDYQFEFLRRYGGTYYPFDATDSFALTPDVFYHFSLNYNPSPKSFDFYLNGSFFQSISNISGTGPQTAIANVGLGRYNSAIPDIDFDGKIDQVRIFDRAITAEEVTTLYNEVAC